MTQNGHCPIYETASVAKLRTLVNKVRNHRSFISKYARRSRDSRILVEVDTDHTKGEILSEVENLIDAVADLRKLEKAGPLSERQHSELYDTYLKVYDLRDRRHTFKEIASRVYPEDTKDKKALQKAVSRVRKQYSAAYRLVYGRDYKPVYRRSLKKEDLFMLCATCDKRPFCKVLCPEAERYVQQGEIRQLREQLTGRIGDFADPNY